MAFASRTYSEDEEASLHVGAAEMGRLTPAPKQKVLPGGV